MMTVNGWNSRLFPLRRTCAAILCVGLAAVLAACGGSGPDAGPADDEPSIAADNPYSAEFRRNYNRATSPLVKGILKDGVITEAEMNEFADVFRKCMADKGMEWSWSEQEGETVHIDKETNLTTEQANGLTEQCYDETDYLYIMPLRDVSSSNPDNLNADEYNKKVLECMKSNDLIDKDVDPDHFLTFYAKPDGQDTQEYDRYLAPLEDENNPNFNVDKAQKYWQCVQDPLGVKQ